jgi:hypothetical protein
MEFRIPSNVVCAESFKNKSILKPLPPEVKITRNFVTPTVAEFREILQNSTNSIIQNSAYSAEFKAIPYTIRKYTEFKKTTYGITYKQNSKNTLGATPASFHIGLFRREDSHRLIPSLAHFFPASATS